MTIIALSIASLVFSFTSIMGAFATANLFKVQNVELTELSATAEGSISSFDESGIVSNVIFHKVGDSAKYTITIKNIDDTEHTIESITDTNESPYIKYIYNSHANETVAADGSFNLVVTAEYATAVTDISDRTQATSVSFVIKYLDTEETDEIPVIPDTGTNQEVGGHSNLSLILFIASAAILLIIAIIVTKKHNKYNKYTAALIITVSTMAAVATVRAVTVEISSIVITANYALNDKLVVTWTDAEGNSHEEVVDYDEKITLEPQEKTGYTFSGWKDQNGNPFDPAESLITSDTIISPVFVPHTYTIAFNGNQATSGSMESIQAVYDEAVIIPASGFTKTGYTQDGWMNGATPVEAEASVSNLTTEDGVTVTLDAKWTANTYTISYNANNGEGEMENTVCTYDTDCPLRANSFTRTGYTFSGWENGGNDYTDEQVVRNLAASGTVTLDAKWTANTYTISYNANNGEGEMENTVCTYDTDCPLRANSFTRTGYTFNGWENGGNDYTDGQVVLNLATSGTVTLDAKWSAIHYTIAFSGNQATSGSMEPIQAVYDEAVIIPASGFTKTGYTQDGWMNGATPVEAEASVSNLTTEDGATVTLDAKWTANTYTISYNANNGEGEMENTVCTYDTDCPLRANSFTRSDYEFDGWNTQADGEGTSYTDEQDVLNLTNVAGATITLYVQWTATSVDLVCKAATTLHTQTCTDGSCSNSAMNINNDTISGGVITTEEGTKIINYGYLPNSKSPKAGDAYDCDINNDGLFNSTNERFYYMGDDNTNARLVYYSGYDNGPNDITSIGYSEALEKLPTAAQWTNPKLVPFSGESITSFPLTEDVVSVCNITGTITDGKTMKNCIFLLENTAFAKAANTTNGPRTGIWLTPYNSNHYRIHTKNLEINSVTDSNNTIRPIIQVPLENIEVPAKVMYTITFDSQGGTPEDSSSVEYGDMIGELPTPELIGYHFDGWSTTPSGTNIIDKYYVVTSNVDLYAQWSVVSHAAMVDGVYKDTLQAAISAASDESKSSVKLLKDVTETITVDSTKDIELDLRGFTVTNSSKNTIINNGKLTITNGTITCGGDSGTIDNANNSTLIISDDTTISATANKQAIYNKGGTVTIEGTNIVLTSSSSARATVHTLDNGVTIIRSGTITSTGAYAVYNESGNTIIGTNDGAVDTSTPLITGKTYGVVAKTTYDVYDGTIRGKTYSIGLTANGGTTPTVSTDTDNSKINQIDADSEITKETIGEYKVLYLLQQTPKYAITFNANGGTASESSRLINVNENIGELPTAEYPGYTFLGWFTEIGGGTQISASEVPSGSLTYYAHWERISQDEIVSFYTPSNAAKNYFNNIDTWSQNIDYVPYSETNYTPSASMVSFWTSLKDNFEDNDCKKSNTLDISSDFNYTYQDGNIKCDQPRAFDTGVGAKVNVYLSDENTKAKGDQVAYTKSDDGTITNMIPGTTYYWESDADSSVYGYVKAEGERRFIETSSIRNVRDLGGLTTNDGKQIKYGILLRGEALRSDSANATDLTNLGITKEYDLRGGSTSETQLSNRASISTRQYHFNYSSDPTELSYYNDTRDAFDSLLRDVVNGEKIYFHCTYGADRTGTIAYLVETLLDIDYEQRVQDYELTTLAGEADRTRIYDHKVNSNFFGNHKFVYMTNFISTKTDVENWYKAILTTEAEREAADDLFAAFRAKVLESV